MPGWTDVAGAMPHCVAVAVVPCYNEAARLRPDGLRELFEHPEVYVLFVDDGSTDATAAVLHGLRDDWPGKVGVLSLERNEGKAEAVRRGFQAALATGARAIGYLDADLSTPASEWLRLWRTLDERGAAATLGSRVGMLGYDIQRRASRHYFGRVFATAASMVLRLPIYDTQCGAKVFRVSPALERAVATPFHSRWAFDVELLGRLVAEGGGAIEEVPLRTWHHVGDSKLGVFSMVTSVLDLARIDRELTRRRRGKDKA